MGIKKESCLNCTIKSSIVSILNEDELDELEKGCLQTEFRRGELIFKEGSPANHIIYLREGFVKLSKQGQGGWQLLYFRDQGYDENPFNLNITKMELASLIGTSRESVTRLLKEFQDTGIISVEKNTINC